MKLTIKTTQQIDVPSGTKIIRNDDWLTLARKKGAIISLLTIPIEEIGSTDFNANHSWIDFEKQELKKISVL